jgi:hypothetical protein
MWRSAPSSMSRKVQHEKVSAHPFSRVSPMNAVPKPKRKNKAQVAREEWARIYGSRERVEWVKAQPCVVDGYGPSENAHTENEGMSRKGHYTTIIPLCGSCHRLTHGVNGSWSWLGLTAEDRKRLAAETEAKWKLYADFHNRGTEP